MVALTLPPLYIYMKEMREYKRSHPNTLYAVPEHHNLHLTNDMISLIIPVLCRKKLAAEGAATRPGFSPPPPPRSFEKCWSLILISCKCSTIHL